MSAPRTALLVLDFQIGVADQPWAGDALAAADATLHAALVDRLFPRASTVTTVEDWRPGATTDEVTP